MNKQELALQYFPDATSATAVRHLTRWIARCHPLVEALTGTGYQSRNRTFTWKQVTLIPSTWASHPPHPDPIPKEIFP